MDSDVEVARARLGRTVGGHWRLERVLGTGGMGAVYAARASDGSIAAVKILHPEMSARREVRERFLREGSAANKIGHPGVVRMLGQGDGDEAFLAMELLEGETLRERVRRHGRLPLDEVVDVAAQVLEVLVAAHERGVIHRDLKPDNLFVTLDGRVKVLDFGLARLLEDVPGQHHTRTGVALGTLAYMAPEQALGRRAEIDGRVDIFALGATLFRVLSGRHVHEAESEAELLMAMASRPSPPLRAVAPDVPDAVGAVIDLALAFARDARYPDARTMLADVAAVRRGTPPPFATARLASRDERTRPDGSAFAPRVQPLEPAGPPVSLRTQPLPASQRTVPLAQYAELAGPYGAQTPRRAAVPAPAVPAAASSRTEPLAQRAAPNAPVSAPLAPTAAPSAPVWPRGSPELGPPAARQRRALLALLVAGGVLLVAGAVTGAYFVFGPSSPADGAASSSALPAPLPSPEAATAPATTDTSRVESTLTKSNATHLRGVEPPHAVNGSVVAGLGATPRAPSAAVTASSSGTSAPSAAAAHGRVQKGPLRKPHG